MEKPLYHLAVAVDGTSPAGASPGALSLGNVEEILALFCRLSEQCFRLAPELAVLSLFSPELQCWARDAPLSADARLVVEEGLRLLALRAGESGAVLRPVGRTAELPDPWPSVVAAAGTPSRGEKLLNLFLNYSSREEIVEAAAKCLEQWQGEIDEENFARFLSTAGQPDPDLIIFAGGDLEPKDFLLWQASYAEIWHVPGRGTDFSEKDLSRSLGAYFSRERRFGRV